jgi:phasin family protein
MKMSTKNPFQPFGDIDFSKFEFGKILSDLKIPGIDIEAILTSQRKNIEALTNANKVAVEGMQALAKRQAEILAQAMNEISEMTQQFATVSNPQEMTAKQAELSKQAFEKALANMRELAEMINKANAEALAIINKRVTESLEELKGLITKK